MYVRDQDQMEMEPFAPKLEHFFKNHMVNILDSTKYHKNRQKKKQVA